MVFGGEKTLLSRVPALEALNFTQALIGKTLILGIDLHM